MIQEFLNLILFRTYRAKIKQEELEKLIQSGIADGFLELLLSLMSLMLLIDKEYSKNIENFNAKYVFTNQSGDMYVAAEFEDNILKVSEKKLQNPTFTLIFKDERSLFKFLLSGAPDVLNALLNQEIDFIGNINYIGKFGFMSMHLLLLATGRLCPD
ncbi:hypothetical protein LY28_02708 [Ruminiclostridium sufflavum DSM 19573]|uniref:SCP-2 sterol transfer family protein n=1 Tax=Ruminiclostridium sufflavum DSM 19573 TaxID=1121337 RepID=A0A318XIN2_9FIRM|nr:hypothetical protein [Ruminiclostridium sufflavum]PYG86884.1 hypothetical protein LY28_02708 [Ruminiclostridium sufflavum DSM 19573]